MKKLLISLTTKKYQQIVHKLMLNLATVYEIGATGMVVKIKDSAL